MKEIQQEINKKLALILGIIINMHWNIPTYHMIIAHSNIRLF